ncbi:ATP-binding protein [Motiliproteus coralliicola]|nr:ATP-binding protein [Motiliproteus coralliicola]
MAYDAKQTDQGSFSMTRSRRLGIRGRFFIAFCALSALTLLASIISWVSYNRLGDELNQVVEDNIQTLGLMADLREHGSRITLLAPTLLAAGDDPGRQQIWQQLHQNITAMTDLLPQIADHTRDPETISSLVDRIATLRSTLAALDTNVLERFAVQRQKGAENQRLRWIASNFLNEINLLADNAQKSLASYYNQDFPDSWIVINSLGQPQASNLKLDLQRLFQIKADVNLLINLVDRAQHLPDLNSLIATQTHADEITRQIQQAIQSLGNIQGAQTLKQTITNIVFLTHGDNNMFRLRSQERATLEAGQGLLTQMGDELEGLNHLIALQTNRIEESAQASVISARETIQKGRFWMLLMVAISLLFSILVVWLYVGRYMVARITSLDASMRSIANGHLEEPVSVKGNDEIGAMARSLISFRDQLSTLQEELVQAGKLAALGQLSAGIAHEINQPLSAIGHYSHNGVRLLNAGRLEDTEKNFNQIANLTKRATTIITRLKSLARNQPVNLVVVDLNRVIDNVLMLLEGDEVRKQTQIEISFDQAENRAKADAVQLEQVILNLITNALDAMNEQADKRIWIDCRHHDDRIEIDVSDNGPGISDALREQIFEPFFTTKRRNQSLGLGLSISYNIIKNFGGRLTVNDDHDSGASFRIQLPRHQRDK